MGYRFVILLLILAANGFFAAAEVSLVSVRQSNLRALAERGVTGAAGGAQFAGESGEAALGNATWRYSGESRPRMGW